jgi:hypothetical protein
MASVSIVAVPENVHEGEADVPCCICYGDIWTRDNDIIKCAGGCGVVVHQGAAATSHGAARRATDFFFPPFP